jgi:hypothetical protein
MDKGQVLIVNLAKGRIGDDSSSLLGGLLVTTIGLAAYTRADSPPDKRRDFFVYVDEFQSFTTLAFANMLSELRKYRVGFTIAHQYLNQLSPKIRHSILGNIGTIISFRVGAVDAPYLVKEFEDEFLIEPSASNLANIICFNLQPEFGTKPLGLASDQALGEIWRFSLARTVI